MARKTPSRPRPSAAVRRREEQARRRTRRRLLTVGAAVVAALTLAVGIMFTAGGDGRPGVVAVPPREASELIDANRDDPGWVVLDVRTPAEFSAGRLADAINIDVDDPAFRQRLTALSRDDTYVVYCRSGNRSARATAQMHDLGFTHVYDVQGGIVAWQQAGLPIVT